MRVVADTNVLISALLWHGPPHDILVLVEKGFLELNITPVLIEELKEVLNRPTFLLRINKLNTNCDELLTGIIDLAKLYPGRKIEPVVKADIDDDNVLACALISKSKYVITGDPHLLELNTWSEILILSPRGFLNTINLLSSDN
ncbi:MAG: putative toxin-antitoxin system toxin component, PIN family [Candidatus Anammoxibacter sp.]